MESIVNGMKLSAISTSVPQNRIETREFYERFGENEVKRIGLSTGIKAIHAAPLGLKTSDLCVAAANQLFSKTELDKNTIDALIFVSQTPDYRMPATSCLLQDRLGLSTNCITFDINYGCSAYVYGLYQAALLVSAGQCQKVLLCVGDTMTQHLDPNDQKTQLILGDAAAVTLVEQGDDSWRFSLKTDGAGYKALMIDKDNIGCDTYLTMDGSAIMEFALREVPPVVNQVMQLANWKKEEIGQFVFHQANTFMLNYLRKVMRLKSEQVPIAVESYGNTGPASIPLTLCDYANANKLCHFEKTIFSSFGVGLSWGAVALSTKETKMLGVTEV